MEKIKNWTIKNNETIIPLIVFVGIMSVIMYLLWDWNFKQYFSPRIKIENLKKASVKTDNGYVVKDVVDVFIVYRDESEYESKVPVDDLYNYTSGFVKRVDSLELIKSKLEKIERLHNGK